MNIWKEKDLSFVFCKSVELSRKQVQVLGNKNNINKKRFSGKATNHNDHHIINMGSQR